jgi:type IV secretory pathway ATPase VirB11/archaellum biosynthesis ATPase
MNQSSGGLIFFDPEARARITMEAMQKVEPGEIVLSRSGLDYYLDSGLINELARCVSSLNQVHSGCEKCWGTIKTLLSEWEVKEAKKICRAILSSSEAECASCARGNKSMLDRILALPEEVRPEGIEVVPSFMKFKVLTSLKGRVLRIERLGESRVLTLESEMGMILFLDPQELHLDRQDLYAVTELSERLKERREIYEFSSMVELRKRLHDETLQELGKMHVRADRATFLAKIIVRNWVGLGPLEDLFLDQRLNDIYLNMHGNYLEVSGFHSSLGDFRTNLLLKREYMNIFGELIVSLTNRPWDALHPLFDWMVDFPDFRARIFGTKEPISMNVTFRNLRREPFTPTNFIEEGILDSFSFGLLAFMARHRASMLFTGPKGSGKTSLLSTVLLTIPDRSILVIEDTPEIPVETLRDCGFDVTRYKVASPIFVEQETYERNVREVVYASLRAGPRVVVIGELRGALISNLFEGVRYERGGNTMMATVHGSDPQTTFELLNKTAGITAEDFAAMDIIVSLHYVERGGRRRRALNGIYATERKGEKLIFVPLVRLSSGRFEVHGSLTDPKRMRKVSLFERMLQMSGLKDSEELNSELAKTVKAVSSATAAKPLEFSKEFMRGVRA